MAAAGSTFLDLQLSGFRLGMGRGFGPVWDTILDRFWTSSGPFLDVISDPFWISTLTYIFKFMYIYPLILTFEDIYPHILIHSYIYLHMSTYRCICLHVK